MLDLSCSEARLVSALSVGAPRTWALSRSWSQRANWNTTCPTGLPAGGRAEGSQGGDTSFKKYIRNCFVVWLSGLVLTALFTHSWVRIFKLLLVEMKNSSCSEERWRPSSVGLCNPVSYLPLISVGGTARCYLLRHRTPKDFHNCFQSGIFCLQGSVISKEMLLCF